MILQVTTTTRREREKEYRRKWCDVIILNLLYYNIILHLFSSPHLFLYLENRDVHQSDNSGLICWWWWCLTMSSYLLNLLSPPCPSFPRRIITVTYLCSGGDQYIYIYIHWYNSFVMILHSCCFEVISQVLVAIYLVAYGKTLGTIWWIIRIIV